MNKQIKRLFQLIQIFNDAGCLKEQFEIMEDEFKDENNNLESVTIEQLIKSMESEISYWE